MSDTPNIADLRERKQRALESADRHLRSARESLGRLGYDVVPKKRRTAGWLGYIILAALSALSVAALIASVGLVIWTTRWVLGML